MNLVKIISKPDFNFIDVIAIMLLNTLLSSPYLGFGVIAVVLCAIVSRHLKNKFYKIVIK